jgi:MOSC domain-containing protein YiiM
MKSILKSIAIGKPQIYGEGVNKFTSSYKKDQFYQFVEVDELGLHGDTQSDKRYHGGADKAIHCGALSHFDGYKKVYDNEMDRLALGCNIIVDGIDESTVHIGDIYSIGDVKIQVTEPRQPCWKIGALFGKEVSRYIIKNTACGWYVRVLQEGIIEINEPMILENRQSEFSIQQLSNFLEQLPEQSIIDDVLAIESLSTSYKKDLVSKQ